jgi:hypothetical protein
MEAEDHARDPVVGEARANFPQAFADRPGERHADGPAMLHTFKVPAYGSAISLWEPLQPFARRLGADSGAEEDKRDSARHGLFVSHKIQCIM